MIARDDDASFPATRWPIARSSRCCAPRRACAAGCRRTSSARASARPASPSSSSSRPPAASSSCARCAARLHTSKANATEVVGTLEARGLVARRRLEHDRRAAAVALTPPGEEVVDRLFPEHSARVERAFAVLDEAEKRSLAEICRKLAA